MTVRSIVGLRHRHPFRALLDTRSTTSWRMTFSPVRKVLCQRAELVKFCESLAVVISWGVVYQGRILCNTGIFETLTACTDQITTSQCTGEKRRSGPFAATGRDISV